MHGPCREPRRYCACTALSLLMLSWAAMTPSQAASAEAGTADVVEPPLFELVVTARKRPQVLEDVPASIYAVTAPMIAATATRDLVDLAGQVSGMVFLLAADDGLALTVRGVGTPARPQALDQSIALFLDGTYLAKAALYPLALFDVERVEVVRGPHSTEVGKNASVGALSVVSREPGATNALDGAGSWDSERGGYALEAGADLQLGADSALRLAGAHFDRHGWVRNDATGHDGPQSELGGRPGYPGQEERLGFLSGHPGQARPIAVDEADPAVRPALGVDRDAGRAERLDIPMDRSLGDLELGGELAGGQLASRLEEEQHRDESGGAHAVTIAAFLPERVLFGVPLPEREMRRVRSGQRRCRTSRGRRSDSRS